jgi:hypothetical protein
VKHGFKNKQTHKKADDEKDYPMGTLHPGSGSLELSAFLRNRGLDRLQGRLVGGKPWRAAYGFRQKPAFFVATLNNFVHKAAGARQCQASSRKKAAPDIWLAMAFVLSRGSIFR